MLRLYSRKDGCLKGLDLTLKEGDRPSDHEPCPIWLDIINPSMADDHYAERLFGISIPTREEMQEIEASARLYSSQGAEFMTVTAIVHLDTDAPFATPVTFIIKGNCLATVRYEEIKPFDTFAARALHADHVNTSCGEQIMLGLLESMIDRLADGMERVGVQIDGISREVFRHKNTNGRSTKDRDFQKALIMIGREGELLGMLRESLVSLNRLLTWHTAGTNGDGQGGKEIRARIKVMQRDVISLTDHASYQSTKVAFLLDATLGLINLEQNQIIKIFSIAAVCLMPPTLVASIYGMNFKNIPELDFTYGYPMALIAMVVSAIVPVLYFRSKGWL